MPPNFASGQLLPTRFLSSYSEELSAHRGGPPVNHRSRMRVRMTDVPDRPGRCRDHEHAENDMRGHDVRVGREAKQPGRHDQPEPEDEIYPLFPLSEHRKGRQGERAKDNAHNPGVPSRHRHSGESDDPGGDEQADREDEIDPVLTPSSFHQFACHDNLHSEA